MVWFLSFIFFFVNPVFAKNSVSGSKQKKLSPPVVKAVKKEVKKHNKTRTANHLPVSNSVLKKKDLLPENYTQPKYSAEILKEELEAHLKEISSVCSSQGAASLLISKIDRLRDFLKDKLQDPNMEGEVEHLFRDILMLIGEEPSTEVLKSADFKRSYKTAFGIRGEINLSDYPKWALHIEKALSCAEGETTSK